MSLRRRNDMSSLPVRNERQEQWHHGGISQQSMNGSSQSFRSASTSSRYGSFAASSSMSSSSPSAFSDVPSGVQSFPPTATMRSSDPGPTNGRGGWGHRDHYRRAPSPPQQRSVSLDLDDDNNNLASPRPRRVDIENSGATPRRRHHPAFASAAAASPSYPLFTIRGTACTVLCLLLVLVPSTKSRKLHAEFSDLTREFNGLMRQYKSKSDELSQARSRMWDLEGSIRHWKANNRDHAVEIHDLYEGKGAAHEGEAKIKSKIEDLQAEIQAISRREAEDSYGPGPHRVEIGVRFLNDAGKAAEPGSFQVEMTSLEYMPHAVEHFLKTVEAGLWEGAALVHHADHVIQSSPTDFRTTDSVRDRFLEAGLHRLAFQEYHPLSPHEPYTLGYSGRPGGLEFFINTKDNDVLHGPGGQRSHDLHEEGDPCFGRVIKGFDVVDRIYQKGLGEGEGRRKVNVVGIESTKILPSQ